MTGLAAAIKLTPLVFIPYLFLTRKFRAAAAVTGTFLATIAAGFVLLHHDSRDFWLHGLFIQDGRTGFVGATENQSLRALTTRLAGSIHARDRALAGPGPGGDGGRPAGRRPYSTGPGTRCSAC